MYNELLTALRATGIPFAEIAWNNAPQTGSYGVIALDGAAGAVWADGLCKAQALEGTVDLFTRDKGLDKITTIQSVFAAQGVSFRLNSIQFESARRLNHYEWTFQLEAM